MSSIGRCNHFAKLPLLALLASLAFACASSPRQVSDIPAATTGRAESEVDSIAEAYVRLVLALGLHDDGFVDSYFGPLEWRLEAEADSLTLLEIEHRATLLLERLERALPDPDDATRLRRAQFLEGQLGAVRGRAQIVGGTHMTFDEESRVLYDAVLPLMDHAELDQLHAELDARLPGEGDLAGRFNQWLSRFILPVDRVDVVLRAAVDECRRRTAEHIAIPEEEGFTLEYVHGVAWYGFAQYRGSYQSAVLINLDIEMDPEKLLLLGCHETYPGHHLQALLLDQRLVRDRGLVEYSVVPLRSPLILLYEGLADFGYDLALPVSDRITFGQERLFPLAGLDPAGASEFFSLMDIYNRLLRSALGQDARQFLEGQISREDAIAWLLKYALLSEEDAIRLVDSYPEEGPYIINYGVGYRLVERYAESIGGTSDRPDIRWRLLEELLSGPPRPSELEARLEERENENGME